MTSLIVLALVLVYVFGAVSFYRRFAYVWNKNMLEGHEYQNICTTCRCSKCGHTSNGHYLYHPRVNRKCEDAHWVGFHFTPAVLGFLISVIGWIPLTGVWGLMALGINDKHAFFVPPPSIKSKAEKQAEIIAKRDATIKDLEKQLGIK